MNWWYRDNVITFLTKTTPTAAVFGPTCLSQSSVTSSPADLIFTHTCHQMYLIQHIFIYARSFTFVDFSDASVQSFKACKLVSHKLLLSCLSCSSTAFAHWLFVNIYAEYFLSQTDASCAIFLCIFFMSQLPLSIHWPTLSLTCPFFHGTQSENCFQITFLAFWILLAYFPITIVISLTDYFLRRPFFGGTLSQKCFKCNAIGQHCHMHLSSATPPSQFSSNAQFLSETSLFFGTI